jgi:hypothetical protein
VVGAKWLYRSVQQEQQRIVVELSEVERVELKKSSFESVVVENWVVFWR